MLGSPSTFSQAATFPRSPRWCRQSSEQASSSRTLHYAETIKAWRKRFLAHRDEVARLYDVRFVRMWEFYLACSENAFRRQDLMVFQVQLAKRHGAVPITRDYIMHAESRLRALEARRRTPLRLVGE